MIFLSYPQNCEGVITSSQFKCQVCCEWHDKSEEHHWKDYICSRCWKEIWREADARYA